MKYEFHEDAWHGWLKVPVQELKDLGITGEITPYSYRSRDGKFAYLEEDYDFGIFFNAKKARGEQVEYTEHVTNYSFIRELNSFC